MTRKTSNDWRVSLSRQLVVVLVALGILAVGLGTYTWWRRQRVSVQTARQQQGSSLSSARVSLPEETPPAAEREPEVDLVPVWHQITAAESGSVDASQMAFTLEGERVTRLRAGTEYYLVDREAYEHFVPHDRDDLVKLQLPDTTLRPLGPTASFVELAASWYVPEDIEGELHYRVHYLVDQDRQPGERIDGPFTIWLTPWLDYQRDGI